MKPYTNIESKSDYDVIVAGGGIAGIASAVSAARYGAKTLLIEKQINLGGLATAGLISWYEPLCDGEGNKMVAGIGEELIKLAVKYGFETLPVRWGGEGKNKINHDRYATMFSPTIFSPVLQNYCDENNIEVRYDSLICGVEKENEYCKGVYTEELDGRKYYSCHAVIDATGTAMICRMLGIPTELGKNYFSLITHCFNSSDIEKYNHTGDLCKLRRWKSYGCNMCGGGNNEEDKKIRYCESSDDVNDYIITGHRKLFRDLQKDDKDTRDIMTLPSMPQYRKIRRMIGEYTFTGTENGYEFVDAIGRCGDFRCAGKHYEIPYRCLYNKNFPNTFSAGRIISSSCDGWEITRVIPVCALTGEAAGKAAAICALKNIDADKIDVPMLQKELKNVGVNLR